MLCHGNSHENTTLFAGIIHGITTLIPRIIPGITILMPGIIPGITTLIPGIIPGTSVRKHTWTITNNMVVSSREPFILVIAQHGIATVAATLHM